MEKEIIFEVFLNNEMRTNHNRLCLVFLATKALLIGKLDGFKSLAVLNIYAVLANQL